MNKFLLIAFVIVLAGLSQSAICQVQTYKFTHKYLGPDSVELKCCYYVPRSYDSTKSYPFFYAWHGAGMPAKDMRTIIMSTIATGIDAIVAAPDFNNLSSNGYLVSEYLNALLDSSLNFINGSYNIDPARSILTGYSAGGRISFALGLNYPEQWAGIIGFAPAFAHSDMDSTMWENIGKIRMATILGDQDFNYPYVDALMKEIPGRGGNLRYKVKPGVAHSDQYYNSQEFKDDYMDCYNYVINVVSNPAVSEPFDFSINMYPSPAVNELLVHLNPQQGQRAEIVITNVIGKTFYRGSSEDAMSGASWQISTSSWIPGLYSARISVDGRTVNRKIMVSR
jgi:type IX secretion system substrate protein/putative esterase